MIAEALNAFCEAIESLDRIDGVKEVCAEFSISGLAFEHVIDGDGHGVSYGNKGSFLATSHGNASVLSAIVAVLFSHGAVRSFNNAQRKARLPLRVLPLFRLPALSFCPGQSPIQEAK